MLMIVLYKGDWWETHCIVIGGQLKAGKYVGECLEGGVFDIQLLRYVHDIR